MEIDTIDFISILGLVFNLMLCILMPNTDEIAYVFTNIIFLFPFARSISFKYYDIALLAFTIVVASSGWHALGTNPWQDFDALLSYLFIYYISLRILPYPNLAVLLMIALVESCVDYFMVDYHFVELYIHIGIVSVLVVINRNTMNWKIITAIVLLFGVAFICKISETNKMHGIWHLLTATALYMCIHSIRYTSSKTRTNRVVLNRLQE